MGTLVIVILTTTLTWATFIVGLLGVKKIIGTPAKKSPPVTSSCKTAVDYSQYNVTGDD